MIGTLGVDGWTVTFSTARRGLSGVAAINHFARAEQLWLNFHLHQYHSYRFTQLLYQQQLQNIIECEAFSCLRVILDRQHIGIPHRLCGQPNTVFQLSRSIILHSNLQLAASDFCRAMLCIRAPYAVARCLSVLPSITFLYSIETNKHIFKNFHRPLAIPF